MTRHKRGTPWLFLAPFLIVFTGFLVAPLLYAVYLSFFRTRFTGGTFYAGVANYTRAISDTLFHEGLGRVLLFTAIQVPVMLTLALLAALALDSGRLRFPRLLRLGIFAPYAVPSVVAALMWGYLYGGQFGLAGQVAERTGLPLPNFLSNDWMLASVANVTTWEFAGYNMLIFFAALSSISPELYEAAEIDGAGEFRKAWSIKLPALRPALLLTLTFSVIGSLQLVNEPIVLQQLAPATVTTNYTPNLYAYSLAFQGNQFNYSAAVSVVLGGFVVILAYTAQLLMNRRRAGK